MKMLGYFSFLHFSLQRYSKESNVRCRSLAYIYSVEGPLELINCDGTVSMYGDVCTQSGHPQEMCVAYKDSCENTCRERPLNPYSSTLTDSRSFRQTYLPRFTLCETSAAGDGTEWKASTERTDL